MAPSIKSKISRLLANKDVVSLEAKLAHGLPSDLGPILSERPIKDLSAAVFSSLEHDAKHKFLKTLTQMVKKRASWLVATTVGVALVGIVLWGSLMGSMPPLVLKWLGFDPVTSSAPFVATLVEVTGLTIYFTVALVIML